MDALLGVPLEELAQDAATTERRREREFYRYYEPICALSPVNPSRVNLFDETAARNHIARSSPDKSLTAFCQLGALRLRAKRCLLFFFDVDNAYILAEATRTLSLENDNTHDDDDGLWLGNVVIPRGISVCEHTVNIHIKNEGSNSGQKNSDVVHIIDDLKDDTRFCDRPFVTDGPRARFYAGVPIITPNGDRIGAYCVLDDKPRQGLNDKDVHFLVEMGKTVMDHIETVKSRAEFQRGSQMLTSMEKFFNSTPIVAASRKPSAQTVEPIKPLSQVEAALLTPAAECAIDYFNGDAATAEANTLNGEAQMTTTPAQVDKFMPPLEIGSKISPATDELDQVFEQNVKSTFHTAATLIRSAADVDGIVFLDMSSQTQGSFSGGSRQTRGKDSDTDSAQSTTAENTSPDYRTSGSEEDARQVTHCPLLGSSMRPGTLPRTSQVNAVPSKLVRSLLRRYPQGKMWYFDAIGDASIVDSYSEHTDTQSSMDDTVKPLTARKRLSRAQEAIEIQKLFPGVRALGLVSVYDQAKDRIFAGGFMWTYSPVRILTAEADLGYLRAFSDVIMANVARLQARMDDQAKSNFISSISHELRSPLHGILGSIDLLQEQKTMDWSVVSQIEKCSVTLVDVIEHLLEYAKINNLTHTQRLKTKHRAWLGNNAVAQRHDRLQSITRLTEEVADAAFYSHCCNMDVTEHGNVAFILDVAADQLEDLEVPVGTWKRLCINIINNALKYTAKGHVSVSLKAVQRLKRKPIAELTVTDTGRGMSRDFLEHGLFKAFSQEDSLANGTGLGMSLVAKLVRSVRGKIEVQSTKDIGTTMKVTIPMDVKEVLTREPVMTGVSVSLPKVVPSSDPIKHNDQTLQNTALERACQTLGLETVSAGADIVMLRETDLAQDLSSEDFKASLSGNAAIMLCTSFASAATLRQSAVAKTIKSHVEYIAQPFGPQRLAEAIERCRPTDSVSSPGLTSGVQDGTPRPQDLRPIALRRGHAEMRSPRPVSRKSFVVSASADDASIVSQKSASSVPVTPESTNTDISMPSTSPKMVAEYQSRRPLSILIVDDNRINVRILMTYADRNKHPRLTATNGEEAVQAYQSAAMGTTTTDEQGRPVPKPDVVLMDINMPVMDGFEATRRIRAIEKSHNLPAATIIALTGLGSADAHKQALAVGVDIFLTKPIRPKDLKPLLESIDHGLRDMQK